MYETATSDKETFGSAAHHNFEVLEHVLFWYFAAHGWQSLSPLDHKSLEKSLFSLASIYSCCFLRANVFNSTMKMPLKA